MKSQKKSALVWLRRDLRLHDHHALSVATHQYENVYCVFVFDTQILEKLNNPADRRLTFIHDSLKEIKEELRLHGSDLFILHGDPVEKIPKFAKKMSVSEVFVNKDYESYAISRDHRVLQALEKENIAWTSLKDQVIFEEQEILNLKKEPFRVFTPYKNAWLKSFHLKDHAKNFIVQKNSFAKIDESVSFPTLSQIGFKKSALWLDAGFGAAKKELNRFQKKIDDYHIQRNQIAIAGTSHLSVHLRFGTLSIRECVRACEEISGMGKKTWISELIWRDFFHMILSQFPFVEKQTFQEKHRDIKWLGKKEHFELWCQGKTGYPLVDAAMRHFNQTGWMHNRLRMIVATFLVKDLLIDYKKGEKYFADNLLDFDLAVNNGNWQWCASTGCDAQPYFRIFNPEIQQKKFDPQYEYIKSHCAEFGTAQYPQPIVVHDKQRQICLKMYADSSMPPSLK